MSSYLTLNTVIGEKRNQNKSVEKEASKVEGAIFKGLQILKTTGWTLEETLPHQLPNLKKPLFKDITNKSHPYLTFYTSIYKLTLV